jgi:hypothetical protein
MHSRATCIQVELMPVDNKPVGVFITACAIRRFYSSYCDNMQEVVVMYKASTLRFVTFTLEDIRLNIYCSVRKILPIY